MMHGANMAASSCFSVWSSVGGGGAHRRAVSVADCNSRPATLFTRLTLACVASATEDATESKRVGGGCATAVECVGNAAA